MFKLTLADGTVVEFAGLNGTNYITPDKTEIDVNIFTDENLKSGTIEDESGNVEEFSNWSFIQQQKQLDGDYYIAFRQKTDAELENEERDSYIATLEDALVELYESMI